jgi:hypothetical protein
MGFDVKSNNSNSQKLEGGSQNADKNAWSINLALRTWTESMQGTNMCPLPRPVFFCLLTPDS